MEMIKRGTRMAVLDRFTSVFYETGDNLALKPNSIRESELRAKLAPNWIKKTRPLFLFLHRVRG